MVGTREPWLDMATMVLVMAAAPPGFVVLVMVRGSKTLGRAFLWWWL